MDFVDPFFLDRDRCKSIADRDKKQRFTLTLS